MNDKRCGYCNAPAHATRLDSIICEVQTRQVTMYPGREPRNDELLVEEIERLRAELFEYWWYTMAHECIDKGDGWLCPYMSEAEYASMELVKAGQAEKHPDHDWYRPVKGAA